MKKATIIKGTKKVMMLFGTVSAVFTTACMTEPQEIYGVTFKGRQVNWQPGPDVEINNYGNNNAYAGYGYYRGHEIEHMVFGHGGHGGMGPGFGPGGHGGFGPGPYNGGRIIDNGTNTVVIGDGGYGYGDYSIPNYGLSSSATTLYVGPNSTVNPTAGTHLGNTLDGTTGYYRNYKTNSR